MKHGIHNPRGERESKKYIEQCYIAMSFLHSHLPIGIGDSPLFFFFPFPFLHLNLKKKKVKINCLCIILTELHKQTEESTQLILLI